MSPSTVRWGGIMVFVGIALVILIPIGFVSAIGIEGMSRNARAGAAIAPQMQMMSIVMNVVMAVVVSFVFYATKGYFNALGYRRADIVIYLIIGTQILSAIIGAITNSSAGLSGILQAGGGQALGVVGVVAIVTGLVVLVALLVFAIFAISFGNVGGGIWKAIGILYLIGLLGMLIGIIILMVTVGFALSGGTSAGAGAGGAVMASVLLIVGFLCYAAAIICHGIGLILGAGRMEREGNPAEVFD